ncbi:MAG: TonB-dependent receptor [Proteobacteria bacterium]|nr:TonB-dependent receptor [Pseudomonadota bacterium]
MNPQLKQPFNLALKPLVAALLLSLALPLVATAAEDDDSLVLEEVVVTAQKREQDPQDIPMAISILSGENLDVLTAGGMDIRFLSARLPSLQIESSFGRAFPRFYIRGYGNTDFDVNASQPVSLVYDEVVQENAILKGFPVFDVDRVEMLRGPQGTLFGRNTPAGIVKFDSVKPSQDTDGYVQVGYGSYNRLNFEGAVGGAINDDWSARIAAMYQQRDDYVDNEYTGKKNDLEGYEEYAARAQVAYDGGNNFTALFNLHLRSTDGSARLFRANIIEPGTNKLVKDFKPGKISTDAQNGLTLDSIGGSVKLTWDFDRTTLTSVTGYESVDVFSRGDIDGGFGCGFCSLDNGPGFIPFAAESAVGVPDHSQFTQEFRLASNGWDTLSWQAGFFYFNEDITIENFSYDTLAGGAQNGYAVQRQQTDAWALFASTEYEVTESFILGGGLRYSDDEKTFKAERFQGPFGSGPIGPLTANPSDSEVSWDLSATYIINDDVNIYARVAKGFRAPSIQGRIVFGNTISVADSETILSLEGGVKSTLADGRVRLNASVYTFTVDDMQLTAVGGLSNVTQLVNAKNANGYGFEMDLQAYITDNFLVSAGLSYNNTEIDDKNLTVAPCSPLAGCTVLDPAAPNGGVYLDGNSLPQAPEWVANATARYGIPMENGRELYFFGDWAYRDEVSFFLYDSIEFTGQELSEFGLRMGYTWGYGQSEVALYGRNITDDTTIVGGIDFNNLTGFINEPRTYGIEYKARF